jgi:glyoxylase-like metal-dependent hydrolase (beta-lactamase superfamily II)
MSGRRGSRAAGLLALLAATLWAASATAAETLPDYVPLLAAVKEKAPSIDPHKGYAVKLLKPDVYMITEGAYESMFVTTGRGVVLFDAPPSLARHISQAVAETSQEPIVMLVYSHVHVDHIGGAGLILKEHPGMAILAEKGTSDFLRDMQDPSRPMPTRTFTERYVLKIGTMTANLSLGHWHSPEGDLLILIPDKKVVMAVDAFSAGATPFMGLDLTQNMHEYVRFLDQLQAMDFDVMVPGHHSTPATKKDLAIARSYVADVYQTVTRILREDHAALKTRAVQKYHDNTWAVASVLIHDAVDECAREITGRWIAKLEGVDIWAASHCHTALVYAEWDVGPR